MTGREQAAVLLDTHAFIWAVNDPGRLGAQSRGVLEDASVDLFVSAASAWEVATKSRLGKLPGADAWLPQWDVQVARLGARPLPVDSGHALLAGGLDWTHRDPFDRMLAAQAMRDGLVLITRDAAFSTLAVRGEEAALRLLW
ncbi:type II toxin-antitoxin system VapC family toxin [Micrococcus lylae]|uniref:type II toxin-antitoxin system VapC family toxin n=1 Tax=Micrococcus lylae TaxID=1273 RepID=UPI000B34ABF4|nr:type II toxin-antitoxin system VapC family toxin [Micrococcus lylae]